MSELASSLVLRVLSGFFQPDLLPENTVVGPDSNLRLQLCLDDLGLEELAEFAVSTLPLSSALSGGDLESCETLHDVAELVANKISFVPPVDGRLLAWADISLPTIWTQELRGRLGGALGSGYGKDEKMFSRLRKATQELSRPFAFHWKNLTREQQRRALMQAAPLPVNGQDTLFPVSLKLLPEITCEKLEGEGLLQLLQSRTSGEFRVLARGDLEKARAISVHFPCSEEWQDKIVLLDRRQVVTVKSHKDEARVRDQLVSGQAVPGRIWIAYLAASGSVSALLQNLLEDFRKIQKAKVKHGETKHKICDVCGKYEEVLQKCSRCKSRWFCSKDCQTRDWATHKPKCGAQQPSFALKFETE